MKKDSRTKKRPAFVGVCQQEKKFKKSPNRKSEIEGGDKISVGAEEKETIE